MPTLSFFVSGAIPLSRPYILLSEVSVFHVGLSKMVMKNKLI